MTRNLLWLLIYLSTAVLDFDLAITATNSFSRICWLIAGICFISLMVRQ